MLDPNKTVLVVKKNDGVEIGRVRANSSKAEEYIQELAIVHGGVTVDYEEMTPDEVSANNLVQSLFRN